MRLLVFCTLSAATGLAAISAPAAEVYRWVDSRGAVYYSDAEPIDVEADRVVIDEELEAGTMMISAAPEPPAAAPEPDQPPLIVALAGNDLGPCAQARQQLTLLHADVAIYLGEDGLWYGATASSMTPRSWLADASRPNAIRVARNRVLQDCGNPQSVAEELNRSDSGSD